MDNSRGYPFFLFRLICFVLFRKAVLKDDQKEHLLAPSDQSWKTENFSSRNIIKPENIDDNKGKL